MSSLFSAKEYRTIARYIERYGEQEARKIPAFIHNHTYQHCLIIPAYNERCDFVTRIANSPLSQLNMLLIIVINQPDTNDNTEQNQQLWDTLIDTHISINHSPQHHYLALNNSNSDVLLIQRFQQKIPHKQGVGLARKIGADIACQLIFNQQLQNTWFHHTDADTHLPDHYFSAVHTLPTCRKQNASAAVYPYTHIHANEASCYTATQHYEKALNYYVEGLSLAASPYAYHTLGSCIANNAFYYAQARGFPKKAGGEDFYLLNKLAKLGEVITLNNIELKIDARHSTRVPFGTGPAVEKIMAMNSPDIEYKYYHPQCFHELKALLSHFECLFEAQKKNMLTASTVNTNIMTYYQPWLQVLSPALQDVLPLLGIEQLLTHIHQQIKNKEQCLRHCHQWLDAFKTLKLIHLLEKHYPKQVLHHSRQPS
jgi:hypothetical protein